MPRKKKEDGEDVVEDSSVVNTDYEKLEKELIDIEMMIKRYSDLLKELRKKKKELIEKIEEVYDQMSSNHSIDEFTE